MSLPMQSTHPVPPSAPQPPPPAAALVSATRQRDERGAASAEYAAVTACGVGLAGVLIKLLTSDFGQQLLKTILEFFLSMVGIG
jgi:hypothetical protein